MGKKSRRRRKNKKHRTYKREEFIRRFCPKCGVCSLETDACFCYDSMYILAPLAFVNCAWPSLNKVIEWPKKYKSQIYFIEDNFCRTGACDVMENSHDYRVSCKHIRDCVEVFDRQVTQTDIDEDTSFEEYAAGGYDATGASWETAMMDKHYPGVSSKQSKKQRKAKLKKAQAKRKPSPTFFTNGDEAWRKAMAKVLNGDNGKQSHKNQESA